MKLIVPLVSSEECLGALVIASDSRQLGDDWLSFLRIVGSHVGQIIHLARATNRRSRSLPALCNSKETQCVWSRFS